MTLPSTSAAYPDTMLDAVSLACQRGILVIPCPSPAALRLQFNGLRGALRKENKSDAIDMISFHLQSDPPALVLKSKETAPNMIALADAIKATRENPPDDPLPLSPLAEDAEAALFRILGVKND